MNRLLLIVSLSLYVQQVITVRDSAAAKFFLTEQSFQFALLPESTHTNAIVQCNSLSGSILHVRDDNLLKIINQLLSFTQIVDVWIGANNVTHNCCSSKSHKIITRVTNKSECFNLFATNRQIQVILDHCDEKKKSLCRINSTDKYFISILCIILGIMCFILSILLALRVQPKCISDDTKSFDQSFGSAWNG